jgi:hypothetical protein
MSAASVTKGAGRAVSIGAKHWPHTGPALTVSLHIRAVSCVIDSVNSVTIGIDSVNSVTIGNTFHAPLNALLT